MAKMICIRCGAEGPEEPSNKDEFIARAKKRLNFEGNVRAAPSCPECTAIMRAMSPEELKDFFRRKSIH